MILQNIELMSINNKNNQNMDNFIQFLIWLHKVKQFDAMAVIRVVENPKYYGELYKKFQEYIKE